MNIQTTKLSDELISSYSLSAHLGSIAYKSELSASEIKGLTTYSFLSSNALCDDNGIIKIRCGKNITINSSDGTLSANEGRIYTAGNGLVETNGQFSISATYNSIWIDDQISGNKGYSDLSIFKLPLSDYELSVVASAVISNGLYITESDYIDAYEQQICCLTMSDTESDKYSGIAATDTYVREMTKSDRICAEIHLSDFAYKTQQDGIKNSLTSAVQDISSILFKKETIDEIELEQIVYALSVLCSKLNNI